jgi:ATP-dependent RNA helicase DeaD
MNPTPAPPDSFVVARIRPELKAALAALDFSRPTPVQSACLAAGIERDLLVQAKTGSGKTLAFGLPILDSLDAAERLPQALVLAPTRELAIQIAKALSPLSQAIGARCIGLTGGAEMRPQLKALASPKGAQIAIGTPGRVLDHLNRGSLAARCVKTVVLDEGDHLLDLGFKDELDAIFAKMPRERRTLLFSATVPPEVLALVERHVRDPLRLVIDAASEAHADIEHLAYVVPHLQKAEALANLLFYERPERTVLFCATRQQARELSERLPLLGIPAGLISGELDQVARNRALDAFRAGRCHVLVATDVAARGIDVPSTTHVIHFSLPETNEAYVHRSGRTGRAGRKGIALSLVSSRERTAFARLVKALGLKVRWKDVPGPEAIARRRIERLTERLLAGEPSENTPYAVEQSQRLWNALPEGSDPRVLVARLLEAAADLEGERGFDLTASIKAEAARAHDTRHSRDARKVPRVERWARRDARGHGDKGAPHPRGWHPGRGQARPDR